MFVGMKTTTFTYTDPREFDGTPYDAAAGAGDQLSRLFKMTESALSDTFVIARVAELQRQQDAAKEPDVVAFEDGPLGESLDRLQVDLRGLTRRAEAIAQAAAFDPHNPPKED